MRLAQNTSGGSAFAAADGSDAARAPYRQRSVRSPTAPPGRSEIAGDRRGCRRVRSGDGAFWASSPLQFRTAVFADAVTGFGQYEPRAAMFNPGERATVYLAPFGYGFAEAARVGRCCTDVEIRTPGGLILAKTDDFGELDWQGLAKSHEVPPSASPCPSSSRATTSSSDAPRPDSPKTATTTLPFSVAAP